MPCPAKVIVVNAFSILSWCLLKIDSHVSVNHLKVLQVIHGLSLFYRKKTWRRLEGRQKVLSHVAQS